MRDGLWHLQHEAGTKQTNGNQGASGLQAAQQGPCGRVVGLQAQRRGRLPPPKPAVWLVSIFTVELPRKISSKVTPPPSTFQGHKLILGVSIWPNLTLSRWESWVQEGWDLPATKQGRVLSQGGSRVFLVPRPTPCYSLHLSCLKTSALAFPLPGMVPPEPPLLLPSPCRQVSPLRHPP